MSFRPASFRPTFQKHAGQACSGVQVVVNDPHRFEPFVTYLVLIREARRLAGEFAWRTEVYEFEAERLAIELLFGRHDLLPLVESGATVETMRELWRNDLATFAETRRAHLLYD